MDYILKPYIIIENIWIKRIVFYMIMISGSILIGKILRIFGMLVASLDEEYDRNKLAEENYERSKKDRVSGKR